MLAYDFPAPARILRTADVTAFADSCEWTGVQAEDRQAWLGLRKTMLTASDIAAILGEDEHRSAIEVFVDKLTIEPSNDVLALDDPRFWGGVLEQPVLRAVARYRGWNYRPGGYLLRSRKYPFLGATLDAEIECGNGIWLDFEGKTTRLPRGWDEETGSLPTRVLIQVQTQLLVTGAASAIVFALLQGSRPIQIPILPSPKLHAVIVERAEEFLENVRTGIAPIPDGSPASKRALNRLYQAENGEVVALPEEALDWTRKYQDAASALRVLEKRKEYYSQLLKHAIGPATFGVLPEPVGGKAVWRWQTQAVAPHEVEAREQRVLLAMKRPPAGAPRHRALPPATPETLVNDLEESIAGAAAPERIRFGEGRRRSRR